MGRSGETPSKSTRSKAAKEPRPSVAIKQPINDAPPTLTKFTNSLGQASEDEELDEQGQEVDQIELFSDNDSGQAREGQRPPPAAANYETTRTECQGRVQGDSGRPREGKRPPATATPAATQTPSTPAPFKANIPAITLDANQTTLKFINDYKLKFSPEYFHANLSADRKLIVKVSRLDDYRTLQSFATKQGIPFTVFRLKEEKPIQVVIKNIPSFCSTQQVHDELVSRGFTCENVSQVINRKTDRKLPIYNITLDNNETNKKIFAMTLFMNVAVKVEKRHPPTKLLQCYNCQEFNHGSSQCMRQLTCLHCSGKHDHRNCPHKHAADVESCDHCKCANCGGNHPSVSLHCPIKSNLLKKRELTSNKINNQLKDIRSRTPFKITRSASTHRSRSVSRNNAPRTVAWNPPPQVGFEEARALPYKSKSTPAKKKSRPRRKRSNSENSETSALSEVSNSSAQKQSNKQQLNSEKANVEHQNFLKAALDTAIKLAREANPDISTQLIAEEVLKLVIYVKNNDDYLAQIKLFTARLFQAS